MEQGPGPITQFTLLTAAPAVTVRLVLFPHPSQSTPIQKTVAWPRAALRGVLPLLPTCSLLPHAWFKPWSFFLNGCLAGWQWEAGPGGVQHPVEPYQELSGRWPLLAVPCPLLSSLSDSRARLGCKLHGFGPPPRVCLSEPTYPGN